MLGFHLNLILFFLLKFSFVSVMIQQCVVYFLWVYFLQFLQLLIPRFYPWCLYRMHDFIFILLYLLRPCSNCQARGNLISPNSKMQRDRTNDCLGHLSAYQRPCWPSGSYSTCYTFQNPCQHPSSSAFLPYSNLWASLPQLFILLITAIF